MKEIEQVESTLRVKVGRHPVRSGDSLDYLMQPQLYPKLQPDSQSYLVKFNKGGAVSLRTTVEDPELREDFDSHIYVHPSAEISSLAQIGVGSRIWQQVQIRERVTIGQQCIIGKGVYLDQDVMIGDRVKIHNYVTIPQGVMIESGVFVGANVCFNNDLHPRAITNTGHLKRQADCDPQCTLVHYGASIGAGAVIFPGLRIGTFAMIAPGAVVTKDVADHQLITGNPGQAVGYVCRCGNQLTGNSNPPSQWFCTNCEKTYFFSGLNPGDMLY